MSTRSRANELKTLMIKSRYSFKNKVKTMRRNPRRKNLEVEAAYLLNNIKKYDIPYHPEVLEFVSGDIEKLRAMSE